MTQNTESGRTLGDFEIQQLHHPPIHQKLQLVSEDLRYLVEKFTEVAKSRVSQHFPLATAGSKDEVLRTEVEALVQQFILEMFDMAKHGIVVNGQDGSEISLQSLLNSDTTKNEADNYEPFDLELNEEVRQLYAQIDEETVEVTKLRREAPLRTLANYKRQLEELEKQQQEHFSVNDEEQKVDADKAQLTVDEVLLRKTNVETDFNEFVASLREMKKDIPGTLSKLDRASAAITHLNNSSNSESS
ncbi:kinetochore protein Mis14 like-domain-containing protein [Limtongia smithiae]|uniref:kinetochore protein Mis14 like-domain-containing protein n=1 Tax=Limtongia smithiae TaxID=1125753 RepID=UPI0034CE2A91